MSQGKPRQKMLVIDTETTGTDATKHAIVSLAALVWDQGVIVDEFYVLINDVDYTGALVEPTAMKVNGITIEQLRAAGVTPKEAVKQFTQMLKRNGMLRNIRIVAHNAPFDKSFLDRLFWIVGKNSRDWFSYHSLCTVTGALMLEQAGMISLPNGSASLDNLTKLWEIPLDRSEKHDALGDARACAEVLKRELSLIAGD